MRETRRETKGMPLGCMMLGQSEGRGWLNGPVNAIFNSSAGSQTLKDPELEKVLKNHLK